MSISASMMIICILTLRKWLIHRLPKNFFLALWAVVLLRLIVPFSIPSPYSVFGILPSVENTVSSTRGADVERIEAEIEQPVEVSSSRFIITIIRYCGGLLTAMILLVGYFFNRKRLATALPVKNQQIFSKWLNEHTCLRHISILWSDQINSPVTVGILRPKIILPTVLAEENESLLWYAMEHEYWHIRRGDSLWKLVLAAAVCLHWFNPFVWLMIAAVNRDLEITCDEIAVRHLGMESRTAYAYALIHMAEISRGTYLFVNGFSRNTVEERILSIMRMKKTSLWKGIVSFLLAVGIFMVFTTSAMSAEPAYPSTNALNQVDTSMADEDYNRVLVEYESFGVTMIGDRFYYNGELVSFFVDNRSTVPGTFYGTVSDYFDDGTHYLITKRDEENGLIEIEEITKQWADELQFWREK